MKKNLLKTPLILSIIFFIVFSLSALFLYQKIDNINKKTEENTITWQKEMNRRENIINLNRALEEIKDKKINLESHFAKSSDVVPFLDTTEKLATKVGATATVDSLNTGASNDKFIIQLKASGRFESLYGFLLLLENSPYELDFLSVDFHKSSGDAKNTKDPKWEAVFKMQLLSFIP